MNTFRKTIIGVGLVGSTMAGGAIGAALFAGGSAGAATTTTTTPAATTGSADKGNSDPAHEAAETPEREAAEANGDFGGGHGHDGGMSNHDPAHEAAESPERAAEEAARDAAGGAGTTPTTVTAN